MDGAEEEEELNLDPPSRGNIWLEASPNQRKLYGWFVSILLGAILSFVLVMVALSRCHGVLSSAFTVAVVLAVFCYNASTAFLVICIFGKKWIQL